MAVNIATLAIKFVADTTGIKQGVGSVVSSIASGAAAIFGFYKAVNAFTTSADRIDRMSKVADRLGVSFSTIQDAALTAGLAGVGLDTLTDAIDKMSKNIGSGGLSLDKRLLQQADAIAAIKDPAEQAAKAMEIFGKAGAKLLPVLKGGRNAFREASEFIKRFNLGISDIEGKNVERMNDSWTKLEAIISGATDKIVVELAPAMGVFLDRTISKMDKLSTFGSNFGKVMEDILGDFVNWGELIKSVNFNLESTGLALVAIGNWGNQTPFEIMGWDKPGEATKATERAWAQQKEAEENSQRAWERFLSGTSKKQFLDEAAKRRAGIGEKKLGDFGGLETKFAPGSADRDSQAAAKIINAASGGGASGMTPGEKEMVKRQGDTNRALDAIQRAVVGHSVVLAVGNM